MDIIVNSPGLFSCFRMLPNEILYKIEEHMWITEQQYNVKHKGCVTKIPRPLIKHNHSYIKIWSIGNKIYRWLDKPAICSINNHWTKTLPSFQIWYNKNGKIHRDGDKPAIIVNDTMEWYQNGKMHRDGDKPAFIKNNDRKIWYQNGKIHRDGDKPAFIKNNGGCVWYQNGKIHRDGDKPAIIEKDGRKMWYIAGNLVKRE